MNALEGRYKNAYDSIIRLILNQFENPDLIFSEAEGQLND
jgi:hypothetical protein